MALDALIVSKQLIPVLRPLIEQVARHDRGLAKQLRAAAASVPLNIAEGEGRRGGDARYHFSVAHGSAGETATALDVAVGFGYLDAASLAAPLALLDRVRAMTYKLARK
ncbi:MAG: four helix bundle protein [Actinobacteria bacterium]|nr:four helix bundle protein [Actinomycetota bacterium]